MADYKVTDTELTSIANAIRTKGGTQAQLEFPTGFVSAVQAIPSGGGVIQSLSVTQNGTYTPPSGVDGYAPVSVNVSGGDIPDLPSEYQLVEYVESSGTQRIETGIVNDTAGIPVRYDAEILYRNVTTRQLCGSQGLYYIGVLNNKWQIGLGSTFTSDMAAIEDTWYKITAYFKSVNSGSDRSRASAEHGNFFAAWETADSNFGWNSNYQVCLFSLNGQTLPSSCAIKRFKIYQNDILVRDFVPCYRKADVEIGMYDVLNNVFYTNAGTGTFIKGSDVN